MFDLDFEVNDWLTGGIPGLFAGSLRRKGANAQRDSIDQAMRRLQEMSQRQYQGRIEDVNKAMSFYGPAQQALMRRFSAPPPTVDPAPGQPLPPAMPMGGGAQRMPGPPIPGASGMPGMPPRQDPMLRPRGGRGMF